MEAFITTTTTRMIMDNKKEIKTDVDFVEIEVSTGDEKCFFKVPQGMSLGRVYDAAFAVLSKITELAKEAVEDLKQKPEASVSPEEPNDEKINN